MASRVEISKRVVLINSASAALARVINLSVVVWLNAYLLRRISPEELQLWPLLLSVIVLLPMFTAILTSGIGRFVLEAYAKGDDRGVTQIVSTMFLPLLAAAVVILAGGLVLAWHIDKVLVVPAEQLWDARIMMALLILAAAVKPPCTAFSVGFFVQQKFALYNVIAVAGELFRVSLLFVLLFGVSTRVLWVVLANVTTELTVGAVVLLMSRRMIPALRFRLRAIRWEQARELMSFGGWNFLSNMAIRMRETVVLLLLNRLATPFDVVVFNTGYLGRRQLDAWVDVLGGPLYPVVTSMHALGAKDRIRAIYLRGGRIVLWVMLMVGLPAALYAEPVIRLYATRTYLESAVVMVLTLGELPLAYGIWMIWQVASATDRLRPTSLCVLGAQAAIVVLVLCAVRVLGWDASGVALALFTVGVCTEVLVLWPLGLRLSGATFGAWVRETLIPGLTPGCVASVVWAALGLVVKPDSWMRLGLCTAAGLVCYWAVLLLFCLEPRDREDLTKVVARLRSFLRPPSVVPPQTPVSSVTGVESVSRPAVPQGYRD
jgi:O-antigen/teichoic acid export membrane protein